MAIYHTHGQIICRSDGRSAVAAAAYRRGQAIYDIRLQRVFDFKRKHDVEESVILGPPGMPKWLRTPAGLWNAIETAERRSDSQLAREFDIALPIELVRKDRGAAKNALLDWAREMFVAHGLVVDVSFHNMRGKNPHGHVMVTMRPLHPHAAEFAEGSRFVFGKKARHLNDWSYMDHWRETWADFANAALAAEGISARIDHRSLVDQGITDREPGIHVGPKATAMMERGVETERWEKNAIIWWKNEAAWFEENDRYAAFLEAEAEEEERQEKLARVDEARKIEEAKAILRSKDEYQRLAGALDAAVQAKLGKAKAGTLTAAEALRSCSTRITAVRGEALRDLDVTLSSAKVRLIEEESRRRAARETALKNVVHRADLAVSKVAQRSAAAFQVSSTKLERIAEREIAGHQLRLNALSSRLADAGAEACRRAGDRLFEASERLMSGRPTTSVATTKLVDLACRLHRAGTNAVSTRTRKLSRQVEKLELLRPRISEGVRQVAGAMADDVKTLSVALAQISYGAVGRLKSRAAGAVKQGLEIVATRKSRQDGAPPSGLNPQHLEPSAAEREAASVVLAAEAADAIQPADLAAWLMCQLDLLSTYFIRRERGFCMLDVERLPERLRSAALDAGHLPPIQTWLAEADANLQGALIKCLSGPEPVVRREDGRLVAIGRRLSPALAAVADDMLAHEEHIRRLAEDAVERWSGECAGEKPVQSADARGQSHTASTIMAQGPLEKPISEDEPTQVEGYIEAVANGVAGGLKGPGR